VVASRTAIARSIPTFVARGARTISSAPRTVIANTHASDDLAVVPLAEAERPVRELALVRHADGPALSPAALALIAVLGGGEGDRRPQLKASSVTTEPCAE